MQRILVVDDDRLVADTLSLIFRHQGFESLAAYSAEEALTVARDFAPEILLTDVTMPGRDGISLMDAFSKERPACRIVVLTGFYSNIPRVAELSRKLPMPASIFVKPCNPQVLIREATALLSVA